MQVVKDRQNWMGKCPTRTLVFGSMNDFNWEDESAAIANMEEASLIKRSDSSSSSSSDMSITTQVEQAMALGVMMDAQQPGKQPSEQPRKMQQLINKAQSENENENYNNKTTCFVCGRVVWIGKKDSAPRVVGPCMAYPLETDWTRAANAEPYCYYCWEKEVKMLDELADQHRGKGGKKKSDHRRQQEKWQARRQQEK